MSESYLGETILLENEQILIVQMDTTVLEYLFKHNRTLGSIIGGSNSGAISFSTAEIYNKTTLTFKAVGSMKYRRERFSLTLLPSDKVLAIGGTDWTNKIFYLVCQLYDPVIQT
ncbi:hypothetical protein I4U23_027290 [Adineta vaga]|nr:hypothetical protein I4U23_027290 [Adineta vaga]